MNQERMRPSAGDKRVQLMATCLCDAFYGDTARATVEVLEYLGCTVDFPADQTCCGQPAFNGGDWNSSRRVVRHTLQAFQLETPIVVPSGSCAAMLRHGAPLEFQTEPDDFLVAKLANRTWELADFIVNALGVRKWPGRYPAAVAMHRPCHTRGTDSSECAALLLGSIEGVRLLPVGETDQCCGFGGTFAVSFPNISTNMGALKLEHIRATKPDVLVSGDMSCLMHLCGLAEKEGQPIKSQHLAQVLRDALRQGGLI